MYNSTKASQYRKPRAYVLQAGDAIVRALDTDNHGVHSSSTGGLCLHSRATSSMHLGPAGTEAIGMLGRTT